MAYRSFVGARSSFGDLHVCGPDRLRIDTCRKSYYGAGRSVPALGRCSLLSPVFDHCAIRGYTFTHPCVFDRYDSIVK
jgi:hypothetical protein